MEHHVEDHDDDQTAGGASDERGGIQHLDDVAEEQSAGQQAQPAEVLAVLHVGLLDDAAGYDGHEEVHQTGDEHAVGHGHGADAQIVGHEHGEEQGRHGERERVHGVGNGVGINKTTGYLRFVFHFLSFTPSLKMKCGDRFWRPGNAEGFAMVSADAPGILSYPRACGPNRTYGIICVPAVSRKLPYLNVLSL